MLMIKYVTYNNSIFINKTLGIELAHSSLDFSLDHRETHSIKLSQYWNDIVLHFTWLVEEWTCKKKRWGSSIVTFAKEISSVQIHWTSKFLLVHWKHGQSSVIFIINEEGLTHENVLRGIGENFHRYCWKLIASDDGEWWLAV